DLCDRRKDIFAGAHVPNAQLGRAGVEFDGHPPRRRGEPDVEALGREAQPAAQRLQTSLLARPANQEPARDFVARQPAELVELARAQVWLCQSPDVIDAAQHLQVDTDPVTFADSDQRIRVAVCHVESTRRRRTEPGLAMKTDLEFGPRRQAAFLPQQPAQRDMSGTIALSMAPK